MTENLEHLNRITIDEGEKSLLVRPGICIFFYFDVPLLKLAPHIADALEAYLKFIPPETLRTYYASDGYYKTLTPAKLKNDIKRLKNMPRDYEAYEMEYSQGNDGAVGTHAFYFQGYLLDDKDMPRESNLLRIEFPYDILDMVGLDQFVDFLSQMANLVPFQSGNAGFAFKRSQQDEEESMEEIKKLLPRYLGFDWSDKDALDEMRGCTPTPHWVSFLNLKLTKKLGGINNVKKELPEVDIRKLQKGLLIRAAKWPPIGDKNRKTKDIGLIPNVANFLRPTRYHPEEVYEEDDDLEYFDFMAWLARFDDLKSEKWDNGRK